MAWKPRRCVLSIGLVLALFWLAGCGPGSATSLRNASHKAFSFEIASDYKNVHERILLRARQRYAFIGTSKFQPGVTAELSTETQSGAITLWDGGGMAMRYRLSAEVHAIDAGRTGVDLYAAGRSDRAEARLWAGWAATPLEERREVKTTAAPTDPNATDQKTQMTESRASQ